MMADLLDAASIVDRGWRLPALKALLPRPRAAYGAPTCTTCGEPYYPDILSYEGRDLYMDGIRRETCHRCQLQRYLELDLIAAMRGMA